jgi:succinate dehydrogenase/fumarate reductase flavoprotein subunit
VRVEVVEAITRSHFVKVTVAEQAMINRASQAEHQAAAVAVYHAQAAKQILEELGIMRVPSILDATRDDMHRLAKRGDAARQAMRELDVTGAWRDGMTLGQVLKVAQRERARVAVRVLRDGGHQVDDLTVTE